MKKILTHLFVLVALSNAVYCQVYDGYVITESDSLIKGYVRKTYENGIKISLYPDKNKREKPSIFYTLELKEYSYKRDTFKILTNLQLAVAFSGGELPYKTEAKVILSGKLSLYSVLVQRGVVYRSSGPNMTGGGASAKIVPVYFVEDQEGVTYEVNKEDFIPTMKDVLKGAPVLSDKIENKELKFKDLKSIVREYNSMIITRPKKRESSTF